MRPFQVVDVFTDKPLLGNPVAVVLDAEGLSDREMQAIATWTNLSETTFLLAPTLPQADYRLRIFTPTRELPFAGHPTLGSAHAVLEAGRIDLRDGTLTQECGIGLVHLSVEQEVAGRRLTFELPTAKLTKLSPEDCAELDSVLGRSVLREPPPAIIDVGPVWIVAQLASAETVLDLKPDFVRSAQLEKRLGATGISVFGKYESGETAIEVRSFAPSCGVNEDPVCGSGNGSIAYFQAAQHLLPAGTRYRARQGRCVGRDGRVAVAIDESGKIHIGGNCVTCINGTLHI